MPLQATSGAASYDAFGGGVAAVPTYIEDIFSTTLYTGNGSTQTITNGIDLAGKGGLVWLKNRGTAQSHRLLDTDRGIDYYLSSDSTSFSAFSPGTINSFNANGFSLGTGYNTSAATYASWTFREQAKFFDVVTYTGNSVSGRQIAHNLGSAPGCMIIKRLDDTTNWAVYHRSIGATRYLIINSTAAAGGPFSGLWNDTDPSSTTFTLGNDGDVNANGSTYVAYLFAHNAGGFGLSGTDNVISCGSVVNTGNPQVTLGYEPQWVLFKSSTSTTQWYIVDNMRGLPVGADQAVLLPNSSASEVTNSNFININATGFTTNSSLIAGQTLIYIAIRRGPMRTPTTGTSVYNGITRNGTGAVAQVTGVGFTPDLVHSQERSGLGVGDNWADRLRGSTNNLTADTTAAEFNQSNMVTSLNMDGMSLGTDSSWAVNNSSGTYINHFFRRAPGFFDVVCWTGDSSTSRNLTHNLGVTPELVIAKPRSGTGSWKVFDTPTGGSLTLLNSSNGFDLAALSGGYVSSTSSTLVSISPFSGSVSAVNASGTTYVAYLFATCPGVSKVGSFTGTGATQVINCGFTGGARFVLIKATSTTGDWLVWDSARGIVAGNDPYLELNTTDAEVTTTDWVDTAATGFELSNAGGNLANSNGVSYIYLAIA